MNTEKLYPQLLEFDVWQDYLDLGWYLFPINPWNKQPYETEIFELPEEEARRVREVAEEEADPTLDAEAREKVRHRDQKYGHGFLDATKRMGTPDEVGTLAWLIKCAIQKGGHGEDQGKKRPGYPQIGCACGPSGLFVIDLDVEADFKGHDGDAPSFTALSALEEQYGELPATLTVSTPRNGQHLYFRGTGKSTTSVLGTGIDTRSEGGYVILPPSIGSVKDKKKKKRHIRYGQYAPVSGLTLEEVGIAPLPDWALSLTEKFTTGHFFLSK